MHTHVIELMSTAARYTTKLELNPVYILSVCYIQYYYCELCNCQSVWERNLKYQVVWLLRECCGSYVYHYKCVWFSLSKLQELGAENKEAKAAALKASVEVCNSIFLCICLKLIIVSTI